MKAAVRILKVRRRTRGRLSCFQRYSLADSSFQAIDAGTDVVVAPRETYSFVTPAGNVFVVDDQSGTDLTGRRYDL